MPGPSNLALASSVTFALLAASTASAATSKDGRIAYTACSYEEEAGRDTCDIWITGPNGDDPAPRNLTKSPLYDENDPTWSHDGSRIAFTRDLGACNANLFTMGASGGDPVQVTNRDVPDATSCLVEPSWGPDGTEIAFLRSNPISGNLELVVATIETGAERVISPAGGPDALASVLEMAWSPDGSRFALSAVRPEFMEDPITGEPELAAQYEIVTMAADGSDEVVVSAGEAGSRRRATLEEDRAPAWSPDSSRLVFMSQGQDPSCCTPWQVWIANADGSGLQDISADPGIDETHPSWSPDGTRILFSRWEGSGKDLYVMDAPVPASPSPAAGEALVAAAPPVRVTSVGDAVDPNWGPKKGPARRRLTVVTSGRGSGVVSSEAPALECGPDETCTTTLPSRSFVTLVATPSPGSVFGGWKGAACAASAGNSCALRMDKTRKAKAVFDLED